MLKWQTQFGQTFYNCFTHAETGYGRMSTWDEEYV